MSAWQAAQAPALVLVLAPALALALVLALAPALLSHLVGVVLEAVE